MLKLMGFQEPRREPGGRPRTFTLPERREIKKIAKSEPTEHDLPFSTWSLSKPADFLVAEGVVDDISHAGLRIMLREREGFVRRRRVIAMSEGTQAIQRVLHERTDVTDRVDVVPGPRSAPAVLDAREPLRSVRAGWI
ncbi:hypothetical protein M8I34_40305 [Streptomyces sp. MCA2]|nr:hypothetical protein [Streptomyces sp. MCA2]